MFTLYTKSFCGVIISLFFLFSAQSQTPPPAPLSPDGDVGARLNGRWKATLKESDGVELDFRVTIEVARDKGAYRWEAYSRPGAARELVGGGTAFLGSLLGKLPPREALVFIGDGTLEEEGDAVRLKGSLKSPFLGGREFAGALSGGEVTAELKRGNSGETAGTMKLVRETSESPLRDYQRIGRETEAAVRGSIYDPSLLTRADFVRFLDDLRRRLAEARDDLDAVVSFQAAKRQLKLSHFEFIRNPALSAKTLEEVIAGGGGAKNPENLVRLSQPAPQVAFLRVLKWDRVGAAVDRAFEQIKAADARVLILDIRSNPGGDATSMAPLAHLFDEPVPVGAFLGRKWYEKHSAPPDAAAAANLEVVTSDQPPAELFGRLRRDGALVARTTTRPPYFGGVVFLLIDRGTASASEPLAHILKTRRRATLIGERTAGAMLTALPHAVGDGWLVTLPEADFIAADGARLEGNGVQPDIKVSANDVFLAVSDELEKTLPFSAAVLRGGSYESLKRPADAEKAYRAALAAADSQAPKPDAKWRVALRKRLAFILKARGDSQGARREYEEVLRIAPDDAEALAATRPAP